MIVQYHGPPQQCTHFPETCVVLLVIFLIFLGVFAYLRIKRRQKGINIIRLIGQVLYCFLSIYYQHCYTISGGHVITCVRGVLTKSSQPGALFLALRSVINTMKRCLSTGTISIDDPFIMKTNKKAKKLQQKSQAKATQPLITVDNIS